MAASIGAAATAAWTIVCVDSCVAPALLVIASVTVATATRFASRAWLCMPAIAAMVVSLVFSLPLHPNSFHIPVAILDDLLHSLRRQSDVVSLHGRIPVRIVQRS